MRNILLAGAAALALSAAPASATTFVGNVCGVPSWHHSGGAVTAFQINPTTQLPSGLTPKSLYFVPMNSANFPGTGEGNVVAATDVVLRQAMKQVGCFDVYSDTYMTDDGVANRVQDHDVPNE